MTSNKSIRIGNKIVGDGSPCFVSFEIGATVDGIKSARKLIDTIAESGADAVKVQTIFVDEILSAEDSNVDYTNAAGEKKSTSIAQTLKKRELSREQWHELKALCDKKGLLFVSSPSGPKALTLLAELGAHAIKVSKSDINHYHFIKQVADTGIPVILDGREDVKHLRESFKICDEADNENVMVMHCPSGYPADKAGIHLNALLSLKEMFHCPIGYSDHTVGEHLNYTALALGTNFLEKTLTLDKTIEDVEHSMSLEPREATDFVNRVREVEAAFGDRNVIHSSRVNVSTRRSIQAARNIKSGSTLSIDDITFLRPGRYMPADQYMNAVGKTASKDIAKGEWLKAEDLG